MSATSLGTPPLLSVKECLSSFGRPGVVFVDGSWHMSDRDERAEYEKGPRIAGARFLHIDDISSRGSAVNPKDLPHMMPSASLFAAAMDAMNVSSGDHVIIYGTEGCMATSRAYYTFKAMGHPEGLVHLMQGSLKEWQERGGKVDTDPVKAIKAADLDVGGETKYDTARRASNIYAMEEVLEAATADDSDTIIIDARSAARFNAEAPEPRPGLRMGHIPGSLNVPFNDLLESGNVTKFKPVDELRTVFNNYGVDVDTDKKIVCSCGSGVTACVLANALEVCGRDPSQTYVYDGSWAEWGGEEDTPIA